MYAFQHMKTGQIALMAALCTQEQEARFRQQLLTEKPDHKVGFAFITGTAGQVKEKLQRCIIGCALKHQIIPKEESAIFVLCRTACQALEHALQNNINNEHIRMKFTLVSNPRWLAVAIYGEALIYQHLKDELMGLSLHRYSP